MRLLVHDGVWGAGSRSTTPHWDLWLAEKGYVVFDIDYRLAPPPRWQDAPGDVKCAVGWVKLNADRYDVDTDRVAHVGYSAGGTSPCSPPTAKATASCRPAAT